MRFCDSVPGEQRRGRRGAGEGGGRCAAGAVRRAGPGSSAAIPHGGTGLARRHRGSRRSRDMAKEGAQRAEETEQMIDKEGGREAAEGGAGGSLRAGDAKEMRAVVLSSFGGLNKLRVSKKAMPEPQEGELKIRVKAWSSIAPRPLLPSGPGGVRGPAGRAVCSAENRGCPHWRPCPAAGHPRPSLRSERAL